MNHLTEHASTTAFMAEYRRIFIFLIMAVVLALSPFLLKAQQNSFEEGMEWYRQRATQADSFRAEPQYINRAIKAFEEAWEEDVRPREAALYLLKSYYFKGMYTGLDDDGEAEVYDRGRDLGEKAASRFPESVGIKFWYGANLGRWAETHGFLASATSGVAGTLRSLCKDIIELDPEYEGGGGYRILAQVHFHTPKIPLVMGWPSDEKALELVTKAMKIAPEHFTNLLLNAEILLKFDRKEEAREQLLRIKALQPAPPTLIPDRYVQYRARKLMSREFENPAERTE